MAQNQIIKLSSKFVLQEILDRTGYSLDVTTGQRKYGGPPPGGDPTPPGTGHEVRNRASIMFNQLLMKM